MLRDRIELAEYFGRVGFTKGAEIGVADGRYAEILCQIIEGLELICVDPWVSYEGNWRSNEYQTNAFKQAQKKLSKYNVIFKMKTSMEAVLEVEDKSLDFVFIDGVHTFDYVMEDIIGWARKVRPGGIVSGHDYYQFKNSGIIQAVNAYVEEHKIDLNLTLRNPGGHKDDQCPCWWFVKK